jgi:D-alanyl-D-alanine carboxypeptidase
MRHEPALAADASIHPGSRSIRGRSRCAAARPPILLALFALALAAIGGPAAADSKFASILIDVNNGRVLQQSNPDLPRYPASLTKMMTLYLAFQALDDGRWTLDQPLWVSTHAARQPPTKLGLRPGQSISVEDAVLALVTKSANDAAAVIAENLGGTEDNFARRMTTKARGLGMSQTTFRNASGLPDPYQITTARDMSTLALALIHHFPHYYHYFATQHFYYNGRAIANHNHLLGAYVGVDGIKTGYTRASGYNLVASALRGHQRLIGVVLGAPSSTTRNAIMADLFDQAYAGAPDIQVAGLDGYLAGGSSSARLDDAIADARDDIGYSAAAAALTSRRGTRAHAMRSGSRSASRVVAVRASASRKSTRAASGKARVVEVAARSRSTSKAAKAQPAAKPAVLAQRSSSSAGKGKPAVAAKVKPATGDRRVANGPARPAAVIKVAARRPNADATRLARR